VSLSLSLSLCLYWSFSLFLYTFGDALFGEIIGLILIGIGSLQLTQTKLIKYAHEMGSNMG